MENITPELMQQLADAMDTEGMVKVNFHSLQTLVNSEQQYKHDMIFTVTRIKRLLIQLGILTEDGLLQFRFSALVKSVNRFLFNQKAAERELSYLGDFAEIIDRYKDC